MASDPVVLPDFDALWNFDRPESTEAAFRKILPAAEASGDRDYLAQLLTQIARTEGLQMRFDEAQATLDRAASLLNDAMKVARVRVLLERGRVLNSSKRREESKPLFREAGDRARACGAHGLAVDAAHMLGIVEAGDSSAVWNRAAIDYAERSKDPAARKWLGSLYNNLGWTYHDQGDFETARDLFRKALAVREAEGKEDRVRVARGCVARAERSLGHYEEALAAQRALLAESGASPDGYRGVRASLERPLAPARRTGSAGAAAPAGRHAARGARGLAAPSGRPRRPALPREAPRYRGVPSRMPSSIRNSAPL